MKKVVKGGRTKSKDSSPDLGVIKIAEFYINSRDFNGIVVSRLMEDLSCSEQEMKSRLENWVKQGQVTLAFGRVTPNIHILAFDDLPESKKLALLESESLDSIAAYPTQKVLETLLNESEYADRPFTKRLVFGEPQLKPIYFNFEVLERYFNDPRYHFDFEDFGGRIGLLEEFHESPDTDEGDKTFLQTFGIGYDDTGKRVVVVFLRYLNDLSPEHQQVWKTMISKRPCKMSKAYFQTSILAEWADYVSIFTALIEEQIVINEFSKLMGRAPLFRKTFRDGSRPKEFNVFLRPTASNFEKFVHTLDKMLSDNIDKSFFGNDVPSTETVPGEDGLLIIRSRGTIAMLDEWLRSRLRGVPDEDFKKVIDPLKEVRKLRNKPAHAVGADRFDPKLHKDQEELMQRVYGGVRLLRLMLANHPKTKSYTVPDWLYEGRISIY